MMIPIDDHQVHRGDGVFEAIKVVQGRIYLRDAHLDRWEASGRQIGLVCPKSRSEVLTILDETLKASGLQDAILRLFLSRGPGHFSTNPRDSVGAQIHLIVTELKSLPAEKYQNGVHLGLSRIPVKDPFFARIKSCNYLPNVLMKAEALERGLDFTIGVDAKGELTEGSTENLLIVDEFGVLRSPSLQGVLAGTTMARLMVLAKSLQSQGLIKGCEQRGFRLQDLFQAQEVLMAGTTLDVVAATRFDEQVLSNGKPGPVAQALLQLLREDQISS